MTSGAQRPGEPSEDNGQGRSHRHREKRRNRRQRRERKWPQSRAKTHARPGAGLNVTFDALQLILNTPRSLPADHTCDHRRPSAISAQSRKSSSATRSALAEPESALVDRARKQPVSARLRLGHEGQPNRSLTCMMLAQREPQHRSAGGHVQHRVQAACLHRSRSRCRRRTTWY